MKIKVSAVSYLNTLPFIYGLKQASIINNIDLQLDIPAVCAKKLLNNKVDLGLVPVAIIPQLKKHYIVSDYCIGAENKVRSVLLLSDVPLNKIEAVLLDYQSKTSVNLVKVLAQHYWKITPKWINSTLGYESEIKEKTAGVIIGDRTFNLSKKYKYTYDLAEEWQNFTGLPFVFACWVANKQLPTSFIQKFNLALKNGVNNLTNVVELYNENNISKAILKSYLQNNISYTLNKNKLKAIKLFHNYLTISN